MAIRPATEADLPLILELIGELAEYERLRDEAVGTVELLRRALFGSRPVAEALIAEVEGEPGAFALFYTTFSTFQCLPGLWIEDLFVRETHRRYGIGRALLTRIASIAAERGYGRVEWAVLEWNEPALGFYRALGARPLSDWRTQRLEGEALARLARST